MKQLTSILSICTMLLAGNIAMAGCGGCCDGSKDKTSAGSTETSPQVYTCEMHADVVSNKPGKCPTCGMNLIPKKDEAKKG